MSLQVKSIVKNYGNTTVVDNLSFEMDKPGVYALLGTNGAGKTTTIRIILGMLAYDSGEVLWKGRKLDAVNENVGYLAEERGLYPKYTLMDQLLYFAKLRKVPKPQALRMINYWARRLEVEEYIYPEKSGKGKKVKPKTADQLSKGNQQKVQLIATLLSDPELLILDEPLSGLDPVNTDIFKSIIKEQIDNGKYLILSSHQMPTIEEFCEDITILNRGKTVLQGNLNTIKKGYGRVNMFIKCEGDITKYVKSFGLSIYNQTPNGDHFKVKSEEEAFQFLKQLVDAEIPVIKFELREPSLHEIFIEKVGAGHNER